MSDSECLIVAECLRWWRSSRYKVLFSPCSHFTDENYSVVFDTAHAHTKRNSESIHSCSTGSIPCFLLAFPHEHLAYWWPLIPHGKTHHEENETNWGWNKKKKRRRKDYFSYFLSTDDNGQSQWTIPKLLPYEQRWSSSAQIPACLTDWAADIKQYWIFAETWAAGFFWNWIQLMKSASKIGGEVLEMFHISGLKWIWFYQVTVAFPWQSEKKKERRPWTEIKA